MTQQRQELLRKLENARWHETECRNDPLGVDQMALYGAILEVRKIESQLNELRSLEAEV